MNDLGMSYSLWDALLAMGYLDVLLGVLSIVLSTAELTMPN